jgi:hypothetical protein
MRANSLCGTVLLHSGYVELSVSIFLLVTCIFSWPFLIIFWVLCSNGSFSVLKCNYIIVWPWVLATLNSYFCLLLTYTFSFITSLFCTLPTVMSELIFSFLALYFILQHSTCLGNRTRVESIQYMLTLILNFDEYESARHLLFLSPKLGQLVSKHLVTSICLLYVCVFYISTTSLFTPTWHSIPTVVNLFENYESYSCNFIYFNPFAAVY